MVTPIRDNPKMGSGISWRSAGTRSGDLRTAHVCRCSRLALRSTAARSLPLTRPMRQSALEIATANTMNAT